MRIVERFKTKNGLDAVIVQNDWGMPMKVGPQLWYCGYVQHPELRKNLEVDSICHGGITFGPSVFLDLGPGYWVGFDCNHFSDHNRNWSIEEVRAECEILSVDVSKAIFDEVHRIRQEEETRIEEAK